MKVLVIVILCMAGPIAKGQQAPDTFHVNGFSPSLYIYHTVQKGETFYSLGRMYQLPPREIAQANQLTFDSALKLNTTVKIPLNSSNFSQEKEASSQAGYRAVYHQVTQGETLYHIGVTYGKVPLGNIRKWNNLEGNKVAPLQDLIIGYVKYNRNTVAMQQGNNTSSGVAVNIPERAAVQTKANTVATAPVISQPTPSHSASSVINIPPPIMTRADSGIQLPADTKNDTGHSNAPDLIASVSSGSPFEADYEKGIARSGLAEIKGAGTWFSSNIPPGSKKYYVLFNDAARGQIIKITNPLNGKYIYAKVLDAIPKLGENANIVVKVSDAARQDLGISSGRFYCKVDYAKAN